MSDPGTSYRTREEVQEVRQKRDPITSFKERMLETGLATQDEIKKIDTEVKKEVDAATEFARTDSELPLEELTCDIYAKNYAGDVRGVRPNQWWKHISNNLCPSL